MTQKNLNDLEKIKNHYSYDAQSRQAIEEMAELTQAINKKWRVGTGAGYATSEIAKQTDWNNHIAEEIADVYICLKQLEMYLDIGEDVDGYIDMKIERTLKRMEVKNERLYQM